MTPHRFEHRFEHYKRLVEAGSGQYMNQYHEDSMRQAVEQAYRLLDSKHPNAFVP